MSPKSGDARGHRGWVAAWGGSPAPLVAVAVSGCAGWRPVLSLAVPCNPKPASFNHRPSLHESRLACSPRDAYFGRYAFVALPDAVARVCCDIVTIYPPGIPILVPGEQITRAEVDYLLFLGGHGARIDGVQDQPANGIEGAGAAGGAGPHVRVLSD